MREGHCKKCGIRLMQEGDVEQDKKTGAISVSGILLSWLKQKVYTKGFKRASTKQIAIVFNRVIRDGLKLDKIKGQK